MNSNNGRFTIKLTYFLKFQQHSCHQLPEQYCYLKMFAPLGQVTSPSRRHLRQPFYTIATLHTKMDDKKTASANVNSSNQPKQSEPVVQRNSAPNYPITCSIPEALERIRHVRDFVAKNSRERRKFLRTEVCVRRWPDIFDRQLESP